VTLERGASIITVEGEAVLNCNNIDVLNEGLFPETAEAHTFVVRDLGSSADRTITMTPTQVTSVPVQNEDTIPHNGCLVGYCTFNDHIASAEDALIDAINEFSNAGVDDLVIDLRYNGGGYLAIASQLSYMIAGDATTGKTFELIRFNDKHPTTDPVTNQTIRPTPFIGTTVGFSNTTPPGIALPQLNLDRVFILTGANTCSASESIINSLRGIDVEVYQFGTTTCGKPYGFYELPNCGTSYFTIQFEGSNEKGFSDYADGFAPQNTPSGAGVMIPGCQVGDDFTHALGDPAEAKLKAALDYRATLDLNGVGECPTASNSIIALSNSLAGEETDLSNVDPYISKMPGLEGKVIRPDAQYSF